MCFFSIYVSGKENLIIFYCFFVAKNCADLWFCLRKLLSLIQHINVILRLLYDLCLSFHYLFFTSIFRSHGCLWNNKQGWALHHFVRYLRHCLLVHYPFWWHNGAVVQSFWERRTEEWRITIFLRYFRATLIQRRYSCVFVWQTDYYILRGAT